LARNVDGIIVTVPHKFDCHAFCATSSPRAEFLGAVNTIRRNADGSWHGDMFDGLGYVKAIESKGFALSGKKALLVGAGGAGSAIAHSLVLAGVPRTRYSRRKHRPSRVPHYPTQQLATRSCLRRKLQP
jgi:shikimate dehydrogenase